MHSTINKNFPQKSAIGLAQQPSSQSLCHRNSFGVIELPAQRKLTKCPKCYSEALERFETHGLCHDCNYNTVTGYEYGRCHDAKRMRRVLAETRGLPYYETEFEFVAANVLRGCHFSNSDRRVLMKYLKRIPAIQRTFLFLRFWKGMSVEKIADLLDTTARAVQATLEESHDLLRDLCLNDPVFSLTQIQSVLRPISSAIASAA